MTKEQLANCGPRLSAQQVLTGVPGGPGGPGYNNRVTIAVECAMNMEWWRGYHAHVDGASAEMLAALEAVDHTLSVHGHIDGETPLHDRIRSTIAKAGGAP